MKHCIKFFFAALVLFSLVACGKTVKSVLPGDSANGMFNGWLDSVADFLLSLRDERDQVNSESYIHRMREALEQVSYLRCQHGAN